MFKISTNCDESFQPIYRGMQYSLKIITHRLDGRWTPSWLVSIDRSMAPAAVETWTKDESGNGNRFGMR